MLEMYLHRLLCPLCGRLCPPPGCCLSAPFSLQPSPIEGLEIYCLGPHQGALAEAVRRLKYGDETHLASYLGAALGAALPESGTLIPIPLHASRAQARGYNQAALLARALTRNSRRRVGHLLERGRATEAQAQLSGEDRRRNLLGAFRARPPEARERPPYYLVDDVITTGSTLAAAVSCLREVGVQVQAGLSVSHGGSG